jgi:ABC-type bacteriocin/lantibiotic exporter with double-glycine peptidase domain
LSYKGINKKINKTIFDSTDYETNLIDYLNGLTSIIHSNSSINMFNTLNNSMIKSLNSNNAFNIYTSKCEFIKNVCSNSFLFIINTILFIDIINNSLDINSYIIINYLLSIIHSSLETITDYIPSILYIKNIIRKINEFYLIKKDDEGNIEFTNGDIVITNLSFSYNKYTKVLNNKNLKIKKGDKIIIKGESGCGKSTLCKILNKEYDYKGSIKINDKELSNIDLNSLRNNITYSSQQEYIFNGTIKDNITLGLKVDDQEFNKIANICLLDRIIKNRPFKYDTFLFGGAGDLSGGERNLIILARALIRNSKILILDETMKELNDEVENTVLDNIFKSYKDTTIIYVSHKNKKEYFKRCIYV